MSDQTSEDRDKVKNGERSFRKRLSAFLKWSRPYRDVIALGVAIVVAISGAVSWAIAHFATQAAVSYLDCKLTREMTSHVHDAQAAMYAGEIDSRQSEMQVLLDQNPPNTTAVNRLMEEARSLKSQQDAEAEKSRNELNDAITACKE